MDTLFEKLEFKPHSDAQRDYCASNRRFNIPCCGRRWGKSLSAGHRATYKAFIPDTYNWVVGPTYKLAEKEFRVIYKDFEKLGMLKYAKKAYSVKQGDMRIQLPWGAVVEAVSAEKPDSLLGEGLSHVIMSEAAKHNRATWEQYIEPALSDLRGSADFPSTPQGFNWYHGLFMLGQLPNQNDYISWTFPSWTNPVRFPGGRDDDEIRRIEGVVSKAYFEQEYGASFTTFAGAIYDEWDARIHVKPWKYDPRFPNFLAFDFGYANPFVCLDIQVDANDHVHVWREYYQSSLSTYEHGRYLEKRDNPPSYRIDGMWGDPRGANEIATLALMLGFVAAQDVPWKLGVEAIKRLLKMDVSGEPHLTINPDCVNLIRQMATLHVKEQGRNTKLDLSEFTGDQNIQHKVDDHAADALRYFVGPYFVLGANTHLSDIYGTSYQKSESDDFFRLHSQMTMDGASVGYGDNI